MFNVLNILACNSDSESKISGRDSTANVTTKIGCDQNYDTLLLKYANDFIPTSIDLNGSLSLELKSFLLSVDTSCLRKQTEYEYFVALILEKLALNHLKCCNQHYDLYQMREGPAAIVINEFNRLAGYSEQRLEMLNSGLIVDYILSDKTLSTKPTISDVMSAIVAETTRIRKGI